MTVGSVGSELGIFKRQSRLYKQEGSHSVRENVIQLSTHLRKDQTDHRLVGLSIGRTSLFFFDVRRCLMSRVDV